MSFFKKRRVQEQYKMYVGLGFRYPPLHFLIRLRTKKVFFTRTTGKISGESNYPRLVIKLVICYFNQQILLNQIEFNPKTIELNKLKRKPKIQQTPGYLFIQNEVVTINPSWIKRAAGFSTMCCLNSLLFPNLIIVLNVHSVTTHGVFLIWSLVPLYSLY